MVNLSPAFTWREDMEVFLTLPANKLQLWKREDVLGNED